MGRTSSFEGGDNHRSWGHGGDLPHEGIIRNVGHSKLGASWHDSSGTEAHSLLPGGSRGNDPDLNRLRARSCTLTKGTFGFSRAGEEWGEEQDDGSGWTGVVGISGSAGGDDWTGQTGGGSSCSGTGAGDDGLARGTIDDGRSGTTGSADPGGEVVRDGSSWTASGAGSSSNGAGGIDGCCLGSMMEAVKSHDGSSVLLMSDCRRASENRSSGLRRLSRSIG